MGKRKPFRKGQKLEIGFDLIKNYTGYRGAGAMTTAQGEMISNYFGNSENPLLTTQKPNKKK